MLRTCIIMLILLVACQANKYDELKAEQGDPDRPNIIMIVVDDLRWDEFSAMGHPFLSTPNIDRLANEGALFKNAYQAVPLCSPNRASILTGQYPSRHGIVDNVARDEASHHLDLFAKDLQKEGYETAHIGKWHMGNDPTPRPGYDYWVCLPGQGRTVDPILYEHNRYDTIQGYVTDVLTDKAINFLRKDRDEPFFLYIGHKAVHPDLKQLSSGAVDFNSNPQFIPAPRHKDIYKDALFPRRKNALSNYDGIDKNTVVGKALELKQSPEIEKQFSGILLDHFTAEQTIRDRSEMMLAVDEGLGKILDQLEESKILDNTFILFTSDNGYFYGEHGLSVERRLPYEESVRTPLLIRYPPLIQGNSVVPEFIVSVDYAPTILELAGAPIGKHVQGHSLISLLKGNTQDWRKSFLIEYNSYEKPMPWLINTDYKALRTDRYKYIHWFKYEDKNELYDLIEDPYEMNNLIHQPGMGFIETKLKKELADEIVKTFGLK